MCNVFLHPVWFKYLILTLLVFNFFYATVDNGFGWNNHKTKPSWRVLEEQDTSSHSHNGTTSERIATCFPLTQCHATVCSTEQCRLVTEVASGRCAVCKVSCSPRQSRATQGAQLGTITLSPELCANHWAPSTPSSDWQRLFMCFFVWWIKNSFT